MDMDPIYTLIAYLPSTTYALVRDDQGHPGFLLGGIHFEEISEHRALAAIHKYGYRELKPQIRLAASKISGYLETLEHD